MKVVDMHCDTIDRLLRLQGNGEAEGLCENKGHIDLQRMRDSNYLLQNFALFVDRKHCSDPWEQVCRLYRCYQEELIKNQKVLAPVLKYVDIAHNEEQGKMSALLTVEEGGVCKGEIEKLHKLYDRGVRMMTLTWNYSNEIGSPNVSEEFGAAGLTEKGRAFVAEMEFLGMIPDVSHLSDAGFYDVYSMTRKPFVASHSNARAICSHRRNLTDDMIRKLAERGGVTGLNYYADFLVNGNALTDNHHIARGVKESRSSLEAAVLHARHIVNVGGMEVLGLGSDFDGIPTNEEIPGAQSMELLWDALHKGGFSEDELEKIYCRNVLRVYQDCL